VRLTPINAIKPHVIMNHVDASGTTDDAPNDASGIRMGNQVGDEEVMPDLAPGKYGTVTPDKFNWAVVARLVQKER
jgi:hypothetical protein